ncbi:hypothetical protein SEPCBS119000_005066 [Sporothrix epigloea]|uniref:Uncharacterized protein n=1 Tax=Sporothrix epigloea TaxID=1892477 RepID=A0ABP0DVI9_9PEZI
MSAQIASKLGRPLGRCLSESRRSHGCLANSLVASSAATFTTHSSSPFTTSVGTRPIYSQTSAGFHTTASASATPGTPLGAGFTLPADYVPPTQPLSAKQPDIRKAQLLRTYTQLLRTTPLILMFQHNNLTGTEWAALRRELSLALAKVDAEQKKLGIALPEAFADSIRMQVVRTRMLDVAMRITEFFDPATVTPEATAAATRGRAKAGTIYDHDLSHAANAAIKKAVEEGRATPENSVYGQLHPLLVGPVALLTFPDISPAHLAAALSVLAPSPPAFPVPSRKKNPSYHEPIVQSALQKLLLVGGRIEGKAFDMNGVRWVGGLQGGRAGLQAQLVALLQNAGMGLVSALEGAGKSLWLTMESRKTQLEDGSKESGKDA